MSELDEETLTELKKNSVKRLHFILDIINEIKTKEEPDNPYNLECIALTTDIYKKTFDLGVDPYLIEKDLKMLVKMGKISESDGIDGYYVTSEEREDKEGEIVGKRDIDAIAVGKSKAQQDRIKSLRLREIIRELEKESGAAFIEKIKEKASEQGLDPDKVDKEIYSLRDQGEIYEEREGYYKLAYY